MGDIKTEKQIEIEEIEKLAQLTDVQKRREQIKKQIEKLKRQERLLNRAESIQVRKNDTRRKVLVGAMFLKKAEARPEEMKLLLSDLDKYLTKDKDRKMFPELPEIKKDAV